MDAYVQSSGIERLCVCVPRFALQLLNECVRVKMASAESARMLNILWIWEVGTLA